MILAILLAAGSSHRMGSDKLLMPWRGSTVLATTLARWGAVTQLDQILLVCRPEALKHPVPGVRFVVNPGADEGMGSSLRVGAQALPTDTSAVVVGLADMPEVKSETIATLVAAWRPLGPKGIVAPVFQGKRGHPVVFGASHIPALQGLGGDSGARSILHQHEAALTLVEVADPGVLLDLDTPADLGVVS